MKILFKLSSLLITLNLFAITCSCWDVNELNNVVKSQSQTLRKIHDYLKKTNDFWNWFSANEKKLDKLLNPSSSVNPSSVLNVVNTLNETVLKVKNSDEFQTSALGALSVRVEGISQTISELRSENSNKNLKEEMDKQKSITTFLIGKVHNLTNAHIDMDSNLELINKSQGSLSRFETKLNYIETQIQQIDGKSQSEWKSIEDLRNNMNELKKNIESKAVRSADAAAQIGSQVFRRFINPMTVSSKLSGNSPRFNELLNNDLNSEDPKDSSYPPAYYNGQPGGDSRSGVIYSPGYARVIDSLGNQKLEKKKPKLTII